MHKGLYKHYLLYLFVLVLFGGGIYAILQFGSNLWPTETNPAPAVQFGSLWNQFVRHLREPLSGLLLQIIVIIALAKLLGSQFRRIGQPAVVGEIVAGILLGPSLLGLFWPQAQLYLFPQESLGVLQLLAQVGVIIFMFIVGIELDLQHLRNHSHAALLISHASIVIPFFLGIGAALLIYPHAGSATAFGAFALFMGISMSITAFPVLARIMQECKLAGTRLGDTIIACAAVDDVTAWCLLTVVVALAAAEALAGALLTIGLTLLFISAMLFLIRPQLNHWLSAGTHSERQTNNVLAALLLLLLISALVSELIGIHALFGAFLAGVIVPMNPELRSLLRQRLEMISTLLLPLFFAFTGLRTQIGLLNDWASWVMCLGIIGIAIVGKLGGSMLAARWTGLAWRDAFVVGACMNTRGLVELIVLNIGYDLGVLSPRIFAMMVLMALVTTFLTGPLLHLADVPRRQQVEQAMHKGVPA